MGPTNSAAHIGVRAQQLVSSAAAAFGTSIEPPGIEGHKPRSVELQTALKLLVKNIICAECCKGKCPKNLSAKPKIKCPSAEILDKMFTDRYDGWRGRAGVAGWRAASG